VVVAQVVVEAPAAVVTVIVVHQQMNPWEHSAAVEAPSMVQVVRGGVQLAAVQAVETAAALVAQVVLMVAVVAAVAAVAWEGPLHAGQWVLRAQAQTIEAEGCSARNSCHSRPRTKPYPTACHLQKWRPERRFPQTRAQEKAQLLRCPLSAQARHSRWCPRYCCCYRCRCSGQPTVCLRVESGWRAAVGGAC
jgi:hypothetical protein